MNKDISILKRTLDILLSTIGLCLTLPFYPLIALAIRINSKGPIFYTQERVNGLVENEQGEPVFLTFKMIKFRTMVKNAEAKTGATVAGKNDARITTVGKVLRRTRLDELPQFFNVLMGDMSLVGPRPERPELLHHLATVIPFFEERVRDLKPGITGLAQINLSYTGRLSESHPLARMKGTLVNPYDLPDVEDSLADDMRTKVLFDHAYAASLGNLRSYLAMEFKIIFSTVSVMIRGKGQ
jgi:lipopolysaccharide/colanic/teichoic acid biosynthesis glycosyltransferase